HLLQAGDISGRVEAVSRVGVQRRLQQANLVVMVECAHRKPGSLGQFTHLQGLKLHGDSPGRRPSEKVATTAWYRLTLREGQGQCREKTGFPARASWRQDLNC